MLNSVVLLPSPTALAGSGELANAIFRSSSSSGGASLPTQGSPGMQHGLVEALQPLLSYLVVLLRSIAPSPLEVQLVSRLFVAASVGMFIGTERRTSHRPAGVRTMSLVALGACTFTLVSQFGFVGRADQARVAASVASGVGFIGAGVITTSGKEASIRDSFARGRGASHYPSDTTSTYNDVDGEVRGLTTASAIWITAGLGMACGTGLFFVATLGAVLTVGILKISEVITSLGKKWVMVRSILRPKLAQRLAEEEEERVKKEKSARVVSALDEQDHEEIKEDKELKEKETREKEEKEKKKKEKEKLRMEQEQQAKAEKTIAARVVDEESGGASLSESGWADDDDEEEEEDDEFDDEVNDLKDLHKRRSENVEYAHDPFYGDPWKSEVPKLRRLIADDGSVLESPPLFGPTRRRYLKRSRILASRKRRLDRTRLLRYGVPIGSSSSASPSASALPQKPEQQQQQQQQQTQASVAPASDFPTTVGGGRAAVESALDRHVTAVGDTLLSEKRMEQEQQALQQRQQQQKQHHHQQQQQQPQRPPNKPRKPKTLTNQQDNGVAEAYVPFASDTEDAETTTLEPTEALPKKPTKSRGRSQSGGGDGGSGATPKDANIQETTPLETTIKGSSGLPNVGAVMKASTGAPGARVDGKRKTEEMTSSRGETPELGGVFEGAAAATEVQATAEARARLADGWANGLDGSPDSSV